jgi:cellulose synthase/poly-beta-1,6-N-acetylglucosamine synthase-like glycosyltransferase
MEDNSLIIIPTYNESENIELIINKILQLDDLNDILVVDDNSPDGTAQKVIGLKKKIKIVQKGILEAALNSKNSLYKKNHTIKEAKFFLMKNKFKISKIENIDENIKNEKNIFFYKKNSPNLKKINIIYNLRYYNRIISDRTNLKDKFINFLSKLF